jgi:hypothetical protein
VMCCGAVAMGVPRRKLDRSIRMTDGRRLANSLSGVRIH